jgi:hypothetical protein
MVVRRQATDAVESCDIMEVWRIMTPGELQVAKAHVNDFGLPQS